MEGMHVPHIDHLNVLAKSKRKGDGAAAAAAAAAAMDRKRAAGAARAAARATASEMDELDREQAESRASGRNRSVWDREQDKKRAAATAAANEAAERRRLETERETGQGAVLREAEQQAAQNAPGPGPLPAPPSWLRRRQDSVATSLGSFARVVSGVDGPGEGSTPFGADARPEHLAGPWSQSRSRFSLPRAPASRETLASQNSALEDEVVKMGMWLNQLQEKMRVLRDQWQQNHARRRALEGAVSHSGANAAWLREHVNHEMAGAYEHANHVPVAGPRSSFASSTSATKVKRVGRVRRFLRARAGVNRAAGAKPANVCVGEGGGGGGGGGEWVEREGENHQLGAGAPVGENGRGGGVIGVIHVPVHAVHVPEEPPPVFGAVRDTVNMYEEEAAAAAEEEAAAENDEAAAALTERLVREAGAARAAAEAAGAEAEATKETANKAAAKEARRGAMESEMKLASARKREREEAEVLEREIRAAREEAEATERAAREADEAAAREADEAAAREEAEAKERAAREAAETAEREARAAMEAKERELALVVAQEREQREAEAKALNERLVREAEAARTAAEAATAEAARVQAAMAEAAEKEQTLADAQAQLRQRRLSREARQRVASSIVGDAINGARGVLKARTARQQVASSLVESAIAGAHAVLKARGQSATRLQAAVRGKSGRVTAQQAEATQLQKLDVAAMVVQSRFRAFGARRKMREARAAHDQEALCAGAAIILQCAWRRRQSMLQLEEAALRQALMMNAAARQQDEIERVAKERELGRILAEQEEFDRLSREAAEAQADVDRLQERYEAQEAERKREADARAAAEDAAALDAAALKIQTAGRRAKAEAEVNRLREAQQEAHTEVERADRARAKRAAAKEAEKLLAEKTALVVASGRKGARAGGGEINGDEDVKLSNIEEDGGDGEQFDISAEDLSLHRRKSIRRRLSTEEHSAQILSHYKNKGETKERRNSSLKKTFSQKTVSGEWAEIIPGSGGAAGTESASAVSKVPRLLATARTSSFEEVMAGFGAMEEERPSPPSSGRTSSFEEVMAGFGAMETAATTGRGTRSASRSGSISGSVASMSFTVEIPAADDGDTAEEDRADEAAMFKNRLDVMLGSAGGSLPGMPPITPHATSLAMVQSAESTESGMASVVGTQGGASRLDFYKNGAAGGVPSRRGGGRGGGRRGGRGGGRGGGRTKGPQGRRRPSTKKFDDLKALKVSASMTNMVSVAEDDDKDGSDGHNTASEQEANNNRAIADNTTLAPAAAATTTTTSGPPAKTRRNFGSAMLRGLRSGALEKAVATLPADEEPAAATPAPASVAVAAATTSGPPAKTRRNFGSAMLRGLRSGALEKAVATLPADDEPLMVASPPPAAAVESSPQLSLAADENEEDVEQYIPRHRGSQTERQLRARASTDEPESGVAAPPVPGPPSEPPPGIDGGSAVVTPSPTAVVATLTALYHEHNPEKIASIPLILKAYKGKWKLMFTQLYKKYDITDAIPRFDESGVNRIDVFLLSDDDGEPAEAYQEEGGKTKSGTSEARTHPFDDMVEEGLDDDSALDDDVLRPVWVKVISADSLHIDQSPEGSRRRISGTPVGGEKGNDKGQKVPNTHLDLFFLDQNTGKRYFAGTKTGATTRAVDGALFWDQRFFFPGVSSCMKLYVTAVTKKNTFHGQTAGMSLPSFKASDPVGAVHQVRVPLGPLAIPLEHRKLGKGSLDGAGQGFVTLAFEKAAGGEGTAHFGFVERLSESRVRKRYVEHWCMLLGRRFFYFTSRHATTGKPIDLGAATSFAGVFPEIPAMTDKKTGAVTYPFEIQLRKKTSKFRVASPDDRSVWIDLFRAALAAPPDELANQDAQDGEGGWGHSMLDRRGSIDIEIAENGGQPGLAKIWDKATGGRLRSVSSNELDDSSEMTVDGDDGAGGEGGAGGAGGTGGTGGNVGDAGSAVADDGMWGGGAEGADGRRRVSSGGMSRFRGPEVRPFEHNGDHDSVPTHFVAPRKARAGHLPKDIRLTMGNDDEDAAGATRFDSEGAAVTDPISFDVEHGLVWPETPGPPPTPPPTQPGPPSTPPPAQTDDSVSTVPLSLSLDVINGDTGDSNDDEDMGAPPADPPPPPGATPRNGNEGEDVGPPPASSPPPSSPMGFQDVLPPPPPALDTPRRASMHPPGINPPGITQPAAATTSGPPAKTRRNFGSAMLRGLRSGALEKAVATLPAEEPPVGEADSNPMSPMKTQSSPPSSKPAPPPPRDKLAAAAAPPWKTQSSRSPPPRPGAAVLLGGGGGEEVLPPSPLSVSMATSSEHGHRASLKPLAQSRPGSRNAGGGIGSTDVPPPPLNVSMVASSGEHGHRTSLLPTSIIKVTDGTKKKKATTTQVTLPSQRVAAPSTIQAQRSRAVTLIPEQPKPKKTAKRVTMAPVEDTDERAESGSSAPQTRPRTKSKHMAHIRKRNQSMAKSDVHLDSTQIVPPVSLAKYMLLVSKDTQHVIGMDDHHHGREMMAHLNVHHITTDEVNKGKIVMYFTEKALYDDGMAWVIAKKKVEIEKHITQGCPRASCQAARSARGLPLLIGPEIVREGEVVDEDAAASVAQVPTTTGGEDKQAKGSASLKADRSMISGAADTWGNDHMRVTTPGGAIPLIPGGKGHLSVTTKDSVTQYFVANRPEHPFRLIFTLDTQHLLGMNGHDDGRSMLQAFNVDIAETDPDTGKIWMYLKNEQDLQNASQWVRDNKSLHIEEHIRRQCAHPYCSRLREQAETTTRLEVDEAAALAASRGEQPPQRLEGCVSPTALVRTRATAIAAGERAELAELDGDGDEDEDDEVFLDVSSPRSSGSDLAPAFGSVRDNINAIESPSFASSSGHAFFPSEGEDEGGGGGGATGAAAAAAAAAPVSTPSPRPMSINTAMRSPMAAAAVEEGQVVVVAKFNFEAAEAEDLPFRKGDRIVVISRGEGENWWKGRLGGREGMFPGNYVDVPEGGGWAGSPSTAKSPSASGITLKCTMCASEVPIDELETHMANCT
jgi:hypothetical protein